MALHIHAHGHGHAHADSISDPRHAPPPASDGRLVLAIGVNVLLTVGQLIGGLVAGSLALMADALHNLNDAAALALALTARRIARRPADKRRTFGYRRAEIIGALINLTVLVLLGLYLAYQAVVRYFNPQPVEGWIVIALGALALIVDVATVLLTYALAKDNVNIKAALLHNISDALASVGVIVTGVLIIRYGWYIADVIATLLIAGFILYHSLRLIGPVIEILMEGVPPDVNLDELIADMQGVRGVLGVHHVHVWQLDEQHRALKAHIVIDQRDWEAMEHIKADLKGRLADTFRIGLATLEFEFPGHPHAP